MGLCIALRMVRVYPYLMATTSVHTASRDVVYVQDQQTLTRHIAVDFHVDHGEAWITTRCGQELWGPPDHPILSREVTGWWAGCGLCGAPESAPRRSYLD